MSRALLAASVAAAGALLLAPSAAARSATPAQVRALARAAATDPAALEQLKQIDEVGGVHVNLRRALGHAQAASRRARLRVLAAGGAPVSTGRGDSRRQARAILAQRRYRGTPVPRPFHGILGWIADRLGFLSRAVHWLGRRVPGGPHGVWTALAFLVVGIAVFVAVRIGRRRAGRSLDASGQTLRGRLLDPAELEARAESAEARGDLEAALRLRFRAGLLRLGRSRALPLRDSLTSAEARRTLASADFDALARDFDEVVYGRRAPRPDDVAAARERWPQVVAAARTR